MGWRGTLRAIGAASRAAHREAVRQQKAQLKEQITNMSAQAVSDWADHLQGLRSIHTDLTDRIDWNRLASQPAPEAPTPQTIHRDRAAAKLAAFKPRMLDFLGGGSAKKRLKLQSAVDGATAKDEADHDTAAADHSKALVEWETEATFAKRVLGRDLEAYRDVIQEMQDALSGEGRIGSQIAFTISETSVHAAPSVHNDEIVPRFRRKQLASGRLSETKMPAGEFNEIYQDYVASVALKLAGDMFHALPVDEVFVTCRTDLLNPATGHIDLTPILSVQFVRTTYQRLNLQSVDPSDAIRNFNHASRFSRTKGFAAIEPLQPL